MQIANITFRLPEVSLILTGVVAVSTYWINQKNKAQEERILLLEQRSSEQKVEIEALQHRLAECGRKSDDLFEKNLKLMSKLLRLEVGE